MNQLVLRIEKYTMDGVGPINYHDERIGIETKEETHIDVERTQYNYHIIEPEGSYMDCCKKLIEENGCKVRRNSIYLGEIVISASREFFEDKSDLEIRVFFEHATDFVAEQIGREKIISAVVHLDETKPHMHLCFCPITQDGRLAFSRIFEYRHSAYGLWQENFYQYMLNFYPYLDRRIPKFDSHIQEVRPSLFRSAEDLSIPIKKAHEKIDAISVINMEKKKTEAKQALNECIPDMYHLSAHAKMIKKHIEEQDQVIAEQSIQLSRREHTISDQKEEITKLKDQIEDLENINVFSENKAARATRDKEKFLEYLMKLAGKSREQIEREVLQIHHGRER